MGCRRRGGRGFVLQGKDGLAYFDRPDTKLGGVVRAGSSNDSSSELNLNSYFPLTNPPCSSRSYYSTLMYICSTEQGRRNWGCWGCYSTPNVCWLSIGAPL